jgi:hypothetical protein
VETASRVIAGPKLSRRYATPIVGPKSIANNLAEVQQLAIRRDGLPSVIRTRSLARNREQIPRLLEPGFNPRVGLLLGGDL